MLSIMRKQAGSWIIKVLLFAIVVVFVFWGVGSIRSRQATKVAEVNGKIISYAEYQQAYERLRNQYRRIYGDTLNEEMLKKLGLHEMALNQLVDRTMMLQEAKRLKIHIADRELDDFIFKVPAFQTNGTFDEARANLVLSQNRLTTADFRSSLREDMTINKLNALISEGAVASEPEAKEWYRWYNAEIDLNYVLFAPERYNDIHPGPQEVADYFKEHENDYRTEPKIKVRYLFFSPNAYKEGIKPTDEQIAEYYSDHPDEFKTEKTVEARHILFKVDANADPKTVAQKKEKAMEVYKMAKDGKPFDELAKKYSEGPTREQGGYLGTFSRDKMVQPFADKAFSMQPGEISEPVRTSFGWHIIKVEKVNPATTESLQAATARIRQKLIDLQARGAARKKAQTINENILDGDDLTAIAKKYNVPVKDTDFFPPKGLKDRDIENTAKFAEVAFGLDKMAISDVQDFEDGYYLLQVIDRDDPHVPALESVADRVKSDLIKSRQDDRAKQQAEALLAELKNKTDLTETAAKYGVEVEETGFFKRTGAIPQIGYDPQILQAAFELSSEKKVPDQVYHGKEGWYVLQLKDRKMPEENGFAKDKEMIISKLGDQKKQTVLQQWLADLKARSRIEINQQMIQ